MTGLNTAAIYVIQTLGSLYLLIVIVPLTGYLYSYAAGVPVVYFGLVQLPPLVTPDPAHKDILKALHIGLNYTMAMLVIIHILAALWHQFLLRDGLLQRMLPFRTRRSSP